MNFLTFQKEAARTCPSLGNHKLDLCHMVMGMCSELNELHDAVKNKDVINIGEEVADFWWYVINYMRIQDMNINLSVINTDPLPQEFIQEAEYRNKKTDDLSIISVINIYVSLLQDIVKKNIAYNKKFPFRNINIVDNDLGIIAHLCYAFKFILLNNDIDFKKILGSNIEKLRIRYPEKFSEENALNRNLEKERQTLEK